MRSPFWEYFNKTNCVFAKCKVCSETVSFNGGTTNLRQHIQRHHWTIFESIVKKLGDEEKNRNRDNVEAVELGNEEEEDVDDPGDPDPPTPQAEDNVRRNSRNRNNNRNGNPEAVKERIKNSLSSYFRTLPSSRSKSASAKKSTQDAENEALAHGCSSKRKNVDEMDVMLENFERLTSPSPSLNSSSASSSSVLQNGSSASSLNESSCSSSTTKSGNVSRGTRNCRTLEHCFEAIESYKEGGKRSETITNTVLFMLMKDVMPIQSVEKIGLLTLLHLLAPRYSAPSRTTMTQRLDERYEVLLPLAKEKLKLVENLAITCDLWTETLNNVSVLGITGHYIYNDELQSVNLGAFEVHERHSAQNIQLYLKTILDGWEIPVSKVNAVVTDGGKNVVAACKALFGVDKHVLCFSHNLHLIVTEAFKVIEEGKPFKQIKKIAGWFHHSNIASEELRNLDDHHVVQSSPTRWNSDFHMIKRFLLLQSEISEILSNHEDDPAPANVTGPEKAFLREIVPLLDIFDLMTKCSSFDTIVTGSKILNMIAYIEADLEAVEVKSDDGKKFKNTLTKEFLHRFQATEQHHIPAISSILDPRYKKMYFKNPINASKAVAWIKKLLPSETTFSDINEETSSGSSSNADKTKQLSKLDQFTLTRAKEYCKNHQRSANDELSKYLQLGVESVTSNPLKFWKENKDMYPMLYKVTKKYLNIPATSTSSERLFSLAGLVMDNRRNRLTPAHLHRIMFLNKLPTEEWNLAYLIIKK